MSGRPHVRCVLGDITTERVDVIVNAANSSLLGGGGVDGAIHAAGGPEILADCRRLRRTTLPDGLPVGAAVATTAGRLPARWVVHTVGPNWNAGQRDRGLLVSCYRESLLLADSLGAASVAFPAVSAGVYGWPLADAGLAARDGLVEAAERVERVGEVRFVLFSAAVLAVFRTAFGLPQG